MRNIRNNLFKIKSFATPNYVNDFKDLFGERELLPRYLSSKISTICMLREQFKTDFKFLVFPKFISSYVLRFSHKLFLYYY